MEDSKIIGKSNIAWVVSANVFNLITAIAIGLVMPRFVSYATYAGYRTYTLYIGFAYLFHLGIVNGVALRYGNLDYDKLPFEKFRGYTLSLLIIQIIIQMLLLTVYAVSVIAGGERLFLTPIVFVVINLLQANLRHYFSMIDRFSGRFRTDACLIVLYDAASLAGFAVLLYSGADEAGIFLTFITGLNAILLALYIICNYRLVFGHMGKEISLGDIFLNVRRGGFVMLGELVGTLILGIDSIFAQLFFDDKSFSEYSFAVYVIVAAYTLISAADGLTFPYIKRLESEKRQSSYITFKRIAIWLSAFMMAGIFVCRPLINYFMPAYTGSVPILLILGGTLMFRTLLGIACGNFFRAMDMEKEYFANNVIACILAFTADAIVYILFKDLCLIAAVSVLTYAVWFVISDLKLTGKLGRKIDLPGYIQILAILCVFYFVAYKYM